MFSQIDREFWFVGPEASSNHGDRPVYIRVSTMEDMAHITLRMPANLNFVPILRTINPNSTTSIQLDVIKGNTSWLDSIENRPADQVLRKGLLLTSDNYVTGYYEINNGSNPAIFPLKGKNGVGTEFFISGQTDYPNQANDGSEAFDIVATQDNTLVTITPAIDIVGHLANVPFQITLNKGETYSARTLITTAAASLAGSHVVSDKPIAITISDDSIITGGWDIIGDQIVPLNLIGKEYIVIKGFADNIPPNNDDERAYILATENSTDIMMDGNPVPVATLNSGQQYDYPIPATTNTAYIKTTKPAYVYHLSGHPGEAGSSILPPDSCTGSKKIGFNRSSASAFALLILTRNGNQDYFLLNGSNSIITAASFNVVPGTGNNWVYYRQNNMSTIQVPVGANILENTQGKFHLGILNNVSASSEYGYFSDFSTLYLGADASMCPGDSMVLDGGPYRTSYAWEKLVTGTWTTIGTNRTYTVKDTGYYACMTNGDFCTLMDTIHISYYPNGTVSLGSDRVICQGTTAAFNPGGSYVTYLWSNGSTSSTLATGTPGPVWVRVTN
ncbi:MAG: IgGFc-binding protein, partial [Bacteroidota bacterium]